MRRWAFYKVILFAVLLLVGCGGGKKGGSESGSALSSAGSIAFEKAVAVTESGASITDPATGATVEVPTGAMQAGSNVGLTVWSGQRSITQNSGFTASSQAFDLTVTPSAISGTNAIQVKLPWRGAAADPMATMVVAFGSTGKSIVLRNGSAYEAGNPTALIGQAELEYLVGSSMGKTVKVQLAVEEQQPDTQFSIKSGLSAIYSKKSSRTSYAHKTRVGITLHGILDSPDGIAPMTQFLKSELFQKDGSSGLTSPFDEVVAVGYPWQKSIYDNGQQLASFINEKYGDPEKYEVHIVAHSMGGLVARWAMDIAKTPSVVQLVTLGTPHRGVPLAGLKNLAWGAIDGTVNIFWPGVRELADDSSVIEALKVAPVSDAVYESVAGTNPNDFTKLGIDLGARVSRIYGPGVVHDGIVPQSSALGGPGSAKYSVALNHSQLVDRIQSYFPSGWLNGINRDVKAFSISPDSNTLTAGNTLTPELAFYDKDGDKIDTDLLKDDTVIRWSSSDDSVASLSSSTSVVGGDVPVITAQKKGDAVITASIDGAANQELKLSVKSAPRTIYIMTSTFYNDPLTVDIEGYGRVIDRAGYDGSYNHIQVNPGQTLKITAVYTGNSQTGNSPIDYIRLMYQSPLDSGDSFKVFTERMSNGANRFTYTYTLPDW